MANTKITSANLDTLTTLTVDDITIDGSTISDSGDLTLDVGGDIILDADGDNINFKAGGTDIASFAMSPTASSLEIDAFGDLTLDVAGDIILDADGADVLFKDGGTQYGRIGKGGGSDLIINASIADKDIFFSGTDGSTSINALVLDMSDAGSAFFNADVYVDRYLRLRTTDDQANQWLLYTNTNDSLEFNYNGSGNAEVVVDTSGKVGIGTTSPSYRLTAKSDANTNPAIKVEQTGSTDGWGFIPDNTNGNLEFSRIGGGTAGTHLTITNSGNVGIGTGSSVDTQLHVKNTGGIELRLEADSNNSGQEDCFIRFYTDGKTQQGIVGMDNNNSSTLFSGNTENAMVFGTVNNLPVVLATNNTERWIVEAGGKFYGTGTIQANTILMGGDQLTYGGASYGYIGTNSSSARFGYFRDSSNNYPAMIFNTGDDCHFSPHDSGVQVYFGSQGGDFGGNSSHNVRASSNLFMFNAGGSNGQFVFEANGHGMLSLYGESSTAVVINGHNSTGGSVNWIPHSNKGSNESHAHYGNNGDWYIRPASNSGTVYVKNYQAESDERLKENIEDITYGTDEILQLQPRKFNWIDNSEEQNGFIAQEVESVLPNFVATGDMKIDGHEEEEGIKSVNYNSIVATLVKSVQELEARIAELENG